jgi:hypothetical protein
MNLIYKEYLKKLSRFNQWEKEYEANKSDQQRISEFLHLFDLAMSMPYKVRKHAHQAHLENLITDQRCLKKLSLSLSQNP